MNKKRDLILMIAAFVGALDGCYGVIMFNTYTVFTAVLIG